MPSMLHFTRLSHLSVSNMIPQAPPSSLNHSSVNAYFGSCMPLSSTDVAIRFQCCSWLQQEGLDWTGKLQRARMHKRCSRIMCTKDEQGISNTSRIRDEVISPFRSLRMFLYPALIASGSIAGLTALPRLIAALGKSPNADSLTEVLQDLGIDIAVIAVFALLYRSDSKARDLQLAKLTREESLASLRVELTNKRVVTLEQMRGSARFVIISGPRSHVEKALKLSEPFQKSLIERGVTVIPYITADDKATDLSGADSALQLDDDSQGRWKVTPVYTGDWSKWLNEQKRLANVPEDKPVYLSLRMDGRVRGSGVGFPPWSAFVAQLPPINGMWGGSLDGMDGKV